MMHELKPHFRKNLCTRIGLDLKYAGGCFIFDTGAALVLIKIVPLRVMNVSHVVKIDIEYGES